MILLSNGGDNVCRHEAPGGRMVVGTVDGIFVLARHQTGNWLLQHRALEGVSVSGITAMEGGALIAVTHGCGIARSDDGGEHWRWINAGIGHFDFWAVRCGRLNGVEMLFAGTLPAHLYRSRDGGQSWTECTGLNAVASRKHWYFPPPPNQGHVKEIVVHDNRVYVGIEVGALLVSGDQGETFADLHVTADPTESDIHRIAVHPERPDRIIVSNGLAGLMVTENGGANWSKVGHPPGLDYPEPMVVHPSDPNLIFVAGATGWPPHWYRLGRARGRIARTRDAGKTWDMLLGGLPNGQRPMWGALTLETWTSGSPGAPYALYAADTDGQIFESRDGGDHWMIIAETAPVSKGDFYRGLAKNRPRIANVDDMKFFDAAKDRMEKHTG